MLKKLIRHEWRSFWKVPAFVCIYLLVVTLVGCGTFLSPVWETENDMVEFLLGFGTLIYVLSLFVPFIAVFIYTGLRYYKNLFTDEGYLMHTLPVNSHQLILSKTVVATIWSIITTLVTGSSVLLLMCTVIATQEPIAWSEFMTEFYREFLPLFKETFEMSLGTFVVIAIVSVVLTCIYDVLLLYASVSFGHLFPKHPVAVTILSYFILQILIQIVTSFSAVDSLTAYTLSDETAAEFLRSSLLQGFITTVPLIFVFYIICYLLMEKKLNLD